MTEKLKGVVLEAFGAGNIPSGADSQLLPLVERAYRNGTIITVFSVSPGLCESGDLRDQPGAGPADAVSGGDMTIEAAVTKLYYLFSCGYNKETIREKMEENLRGERSETKSAS